MLADVVRAPPSSETLTPLVVLTIVLLVLFVVRVWLTNRWMESAAQQDRIVRAFNMPLQERATRPDFERGL